MVEQIIKSGDISYNYTEGITSLAACKDYWQLLRIILSSITFRLETQQMKMKRNYCENAKCIKSQEQFFFWLLKVLIH